MGLDRLTGRAGVEDMLVTMSRTIQEYRLQQFEEKQRNRPPMLRPDEMHD